jgi:hypothetical protein
MIATALWFTPCVCVGQTERVPASDSEISEVMRLSGYDRENDDRVASFEAWRVLADRGSHIVAAQFQLEPSFAQESVCVAPQYYVEYETQEGGLLPNDPLESFEYWLADSESDCRVDADTPDRKVIVRDTIATDAVISIMRSATEILARTLEHPRGERFRTRETEWRIRDIAIRWIPDGELGFAYAVNFEGSDVVPNGPYSIFTIRGDDFVLHEVGTWAY